MYKEDYDWLNRMEEEKRHFHELLREKENAPIEKTPLRPFADYFGEFAHPGYGVVEVTIGTEGFVAYYNELPYLLKHTRYDHFIGSTKPTAAISQFACFFISNPLGEISELHISIEPSLPPIVFKRQAAKEFLAIDYLKKFTGTFVSPILSIDIVLKKPGLLMTSPGHPTCLLKSEKKNFFSVKELPDCFVRFIASDDGAITELQLTQAGHTISLEALPK